MIEKEKYAQILNSGLGLDHYFILCCIKNEIPLVDHPRMQGFINVLTKKDLLDSSGALTAEGLTIIDDCALETVVVKQSKKNIDLNEWALQVWKTCEEKLYELTGKRQITQAIKGSAKKWPFFCNDRDFAKQLLKVVSIYKLKDLDVVEAVLLKHIETCNQANTWFPSMLYYMYKNNQSTLATDVGTYEEEEEVSSSYSGQTKV